MAATLTAPGQHVYTRVSERRGYTVKAGARTRSRLRRGIDIRPDMSWCSRCKRPFGSCICKY